MPCLLAVVVRTVRELSARGQARPAVLTDTLIIVATGVLLVAGHFLEVLIWAGTYAVVGAAPPGTDLVYFAFSNYTTLGYGDVLPVPHSAAARADDGAERHLADRLVDGADLRHHQARVAGRAFGVSTLLHCSTPSKPHGLISDFRCSEHMLELNLCSGHQTIRDRLGNRVL